MTKNLLFVLLLICFSLKTYAQGEIKVMGHATKQKIMLRWAPTDPVSWQYGLKYGYTIERYTITRDSALLRPPVKRTLTQMALKPDPLEQWEMAVEQSNYAAIAAQAMYGDTFELTNDYSSDITQIVHKTREQEQRFSFALFAADQSFKVARMSGLGFEDFNVKENEKYLYKIVSNIPDSVYKVKAGSVFIGLKDQSPLPEPQGLSAEFADQTVLLSWNRKYFEKIYNSYVIERSDDGGKTYKRINKDPLVNTFEKEHPDTEKFYKLDSLPQNSVEYFYRVRGISPFGEIGPPSEIIKGAGIKRMHADIGITKHKVLDNQNVTITWAFPDEKEEFINGFLVLRSKKEGGNYKQIHKDTLDIINRTFIDKNPLPTGYYKVGFIRQQKTQYSHPYLVQLADSIAPAIPKGLSYTIDTLGIVKLEWPDNDENDLYGYRVYRSNFKNSEFVQITNEPTVFSEYTDSISLKNLTKSIYYRITAIDNRFNESQKSVILKVDKPDLIPPVPPVFKSYNIKNDTLYLEWVRSSSDDVMKYLLYQKSKNTQWELVDALGANADNYKYVFKDSGQYQFILLAVDSAENESEVSKPLDVYANISPKAYFKKFEAKVDRENNQII
ncbi:MAG: hypothetical protein R3345_15210, partial [Fulvivirga sp.]|nr:hypothetical protein [Fulvivirga sp.]